MNIFIIDYDNTIINCDSDYLWNKFLNKLNIYLNIFKKINIIFYKFYEKKILSEKCYFNFFVKKIKFKLKEIFNYIIKIFNNYNIKIKNSLISTSTNKKIIFCKKKILNKIIISTKKKIFNFNEKKIKNFIKIKKKIFLTDSINDIVSLFFFKKKILKNSDKILYLILKIKKINNFIYI